MKWLAKMFKKVITQVKLNKIAAASLSVLLALMLRKLSLRAKSSGNIQSTITENISSFYDKLRNN